MNDFTFEMISIKFFSRHSDTMGMVCFSSTRKHSLLIIEKQFRGRNSRGPNRNLSGHRIKHAMDVEFGSEREEGGYQNEFNRICFD